MKDKEIKNFIINEVGHALQVHRLKKKKKNKGHISYYNPIYMQDSWYKD